MGEFLDKFLAIPTAQKIALLVLMMGLIFAAWWFLFFEETQAAIKAESAKRPKLIRELAAEQEVEKNLVKYKAEVDELKRQRDKMRDRLPDNAEIAGLLENIHGQAKIVGLDIERFERTPIEKEALYARIPVKMKLQGTYHEVTNFFFHLGKLTRIVNVEDIKLAQQIEMRNLKERKNGERQVLTATCTATTFMYVAPRKAAAPAGKKKKKKKKKKAKK